MFNNILGKEVRTIIETYWKKLVLISILMGFLLFVLNIFLTLSLFAGNFSSTLKDKLGIYFYIKDIPGNEHTTYKQIMSIKEELEKNGLQVAFSSKEDAFNFLQKRIPDLINSFKKFDIDNPLPATLYVMFKDENQYNILKDIILDNKNIILNVKDISGGATLKQQENRVLNIINFTNLVKILSYIFVGILFFIIIFFLVFLLENIFQKFRKDLITKKFLGATNSQIVKTFLLSAFVVVKLSFLFSIILICISIYLIGSHVFNIFGFELYQYFIDNYYYVLIILLFEIFIFTSVSLFASYGYLSFLNEEI